MGSHGSDYSEHQNVRTSTTSETKDLGAVDVEIQGQTLSIRSDHSPEFVERIAEYVDAKVGELEDAAPGAPTDKLLMMASLTMAEELFEARGEIEELRREIRERTADMEALLEELDD